MTRHNREISESALMTKKNRILPLFICICIGSIFRAIFITYRYLTKNAAANSSAFTQAVHTTGQTATQINRFIDVTKAEVNRIASELTTPFSFSTVEQAIRNKPLVVTGVGVIWYNTTGQRVGLYFVVKDGKQ